MSMLILQSKITLPKNEESSSLLNKFYNKTKRVEWWRTINIKTRKTSVKRRHHEGPKKSQCTSMTPNSKLG